jgi:hypothetical protein
MLHK